MNSSELKGFLTGLILGDGTIGTGVNRRPFSIKSINKDFIDMIASELESCSGFKTKIKFTPEHFSCGCNHRDSWEFTITAHPYFAKIYHHFYDDYRKRVISPWVLMWLTPRGLANWYMSDGYVCLVGKTKGAIKNRRVELCMDRYTLLDIQRMQAYFKRKFGIETSLVTRIKGERYRLRVMQTSYNRFFELVSPYIVPSMRYKMYLGYEQRPIWMSDELWQIQEDLASANPLRQPA